MLSRVLGHASSGELLAFVNRTNNLELAFEHGNHVFVSECREGICCGQSEQNFADQHESRFLPHGFSPSGSFRMSPLQKEGESAFARAAHSRNISSPGSRHTFTVPRIFTRMPRARIACSADVARCCSQKNFCVRMRTISASISSQVAITSSLIAFSRARVGVPRRFAN
jgi:hypothetical protein